MQLLLLPWILLISNVFTSNLHIKRYWRWSDKSNHLYTCPLKLGCREGWYSRNKLSTVLLSIPLPLPTVHTSHMNVIVVLICILIQQEIEAVSVYAMSGTRVSIAACVPITTIRPLRATLALLVRARHSLPLHKSFLSPSCLCLD